MLPCPPAFRIRAFALDLLVFGCGELTICTSQDLSNQHFKGAVRAVIQAFIFLDDHDIICIGLSDYRRLCAHLKAYIAKICFHFMIWVALVSLLLDCGEQDDSIHHSKYGLFYTKYNSKTRPLYF
jgi:hypothetical protein